MPFTSGPLRIVSIQPPAPGAAYVGPGDVIPNATIYLGLRAYTLASIGGNVLDITIPGPSTQTFTSQPGGGLNSAAISAFLGAQTGVVTKLYDQTLGGNDFIATLASGPSFSLTGGNNGTPTMLFSAAGNGGLGNTLTRTIPGILSPPFSVASVVDANVAGTILSGHSGSCIYRINVFVGNSVEFNAGGVTVAASITTNAWHSVSIMSNGTASLVNIDGSVTSPGVDPGSTGFDSASVIGAADTGGNQRLDGGISELMWWAADKSASFAALHANQSAYYGTP